MFCSLNREQGSEQIKRKNESNESQFASHPSIQCKYHICYVNNNYIIWFSENSIALQANCFLGFVFFSAWQGAFWILTLLRSLLCLTVNQWISNHEIKANLYLLFLCSFTVALAWNSANWFMVLTVFWFFLFSSSTIEERKKNKEKKREREK